jgi:hypothetical protein
MHISRLLLAVGIIVAVVGCASQRDLATWSGHPTHFASADHLTFSVRNGNGGEVRIADADLVRAREQGWWGETVPPEPPEPPADVSGRWIGQWSGRGAWGARASRAEVLLTQSGGHGQGRLHLADVQAVEGVPRAMRLAGSLGVPVSFEVRESEVWLRHASRDGALLAVFALEGEMLVGRFQNVPAAATLTLSREAR